MNVLQSIDMSSPVSVWGLRAFFSVLNENNSLYRLNAAVRL